MCEIVRFELTFALFAEVCASRRSFLRMKSVETQFRQTAIGPWPLIRDFGEALATRFRFGASLNLARHVHVFLYGQSASSFGGIQHDRCIDL